MCVVPGARKSGWRAPEDAVENLAPARAPMGVSRPGIPARPTLPRNGKRMAAEDDSLEAPVVDSPSISADWPDGDGSPPSADSDWAGRRKMMPGTAEPRGGNGSWFRYLLRPACPASRIGQALRRPADGLCRDGRAGAGIDDLAGRCGAAAAADRHVSTRWSGFEVNLRGLMFKDVKISTETVEGKRVLVIEGP